MCFHTSHTQKVKKVENRFKVQLIDDALRETYDTPHFHNNGFEHLNSLIIPQQKATHLIPATWGIVPPTKKVSDIKEYYKQQLKYGSGLNARSEKLFDYWLYEKSAFTKRCIIPVSGFFEPHEYTELIGKLEENHNIDIVLMDIQMPVMDGIKTTEIIKNKYPQIKVIMLTVLDDDDYIFKAIKAGANGYLLKEIDAGKLYKSIEEVLEGGAPMSPSIALKTLNLLRNPQSIKHKEIDTEEIKLSKRETEILEQLSKGLKYNDIADNLIISPATVRKHIENIYKKLQVHNKMEAVIKAQQHKLI
jgi:DNA-binding NarL/FixJ family response regulator